MTRAGQDVMSLSVGSSLTFLLFIRLSHYSGSYRNESDPPKVLILKDLWWLCYIIFMIVPFVLYFANITDPVLSAAVYSGLISILCTTETGFTHILSEFLIPDDNDDEQETTSLQQGRIGDETYQSIEARAVSIDN
mmetsp:Transcript_6039/g.10556  ORF Transcript_6039/g.10556 Transcript_6039/m.10556 type:complete len:136 (-) Transcript_6039:42-449(-)